MARYAARRALRRSFAPGVATAAEFCDVIHGGADSRDQFLHLRAGFPAVGEGVRRGAHFVGLEAEQVLAFSVERAHVRTKKLVRGTSEKIAVERADVNGAVGGVMDGVDEHERARGVGQLDDFGHWIDRPDGV